MDDHSYQSVSIKNEWKAKNITKRSSQIVEEMYDNLFEP